MISKINVFSQNGIKINSSKIIYFDPFKVDKNYNDADIVFITHSHYDHLSIADIKKVSKKTTFFVIPETIEKDVISLGINKDNIITVKVYDKQSVEGITFETVPSYNVSKPMHPKKNKWVGYIVEVEGKRIYVCGDTDAIYEGKKVKCDIVIVPIGGYYTMGYKAAASFVNAIKPAVVIPVHYGDLVGEKDYGLKFKKLVDKDIQVCLLMDN